MLDWLVVEDVSTNEASAARVKLEGFDGEWEVLIIWVVDEESVDNGLLEAFGLVTWRDEGAGIASCCAVFNSGGLGKMIVIDLNIVDDNSPLVACIDGPEWSDISCF